MNIHNLIKERLVEMGAGNYVVFLPPFIEESFRDRVQELTRELDEKVKKLTRELEENVKQLVTDRVVMRAFKAHTAHVAQQQKVKNNRKKTTLKTKDTLEALSFIIIIIIAVVLTWAAWPVFLDEPSSTIWGRIICVPMNMTVYVFDPKRR